MEMEADGAFGVHHLVKAYLNAVCNMEKARANPLKRCRHKRGEKARSVTHSVTHFVTHFDKLSRQSPFVTHFEGSKSIKNESKTMIRKNPEIG